MKIYTSYFAKYRGDRGVSISNSCPQGFVGGVIKSLAPDWSYVDDYKNGVITWEVFEKAYMEKVHNVDICSLLHEGDVLLCWEGASKNCHRHLLAKLLANMGHEVEEL